MDPEVPGSSPGRSPTPPSLHQPRSAGWSDTEALVALFIVLVVVLVAVTLAIRESERDRVGRFKSGTSVEGDVLKLPTTLDVELGGVEVRGFWTGSAVTVSVGIGRPPHTTSTRRYVVELSVNPVERVSTSSVELGRLLQKWR